MQTKEEWNTTLNAREASEHVPKERVPLHWSEITEVEGLDDPYIVYLPQKKYGSFQSTTVIT